MTREELERRARESLRRAVASDHPFVLVDMDAPMRTIDLETGARPRISPDVWRHLAAALIDTLDR